MKRNRPTQLEQIMGLLESRGNLGLSQANAIYMVKPMCTRLAAQIFVLRKRGWVIDTVRHQKQTEPGTFAIYILRKKGN